MVRLKKDAPATWWNGNKSKMKPADLNHVVVTGQVKFAKFAGAEVKVLGWAKEPTPETKTAWITKSSDHSPLLREVQKTWAGYGFTGPSSARGRGATATKSLQRKNQSRRRNYSRRTLRLARRASRQSVRG